MPPSPPFPSDERLEAFLRADSPADADRELVGLMARADPLIRACLGNRGRGSPRDDAEDCLSEARSQLAQHLQRLRSGEGNATVAVITDFDAYVATVARMAWAQTVRRRHPARAMLVNRLRYLLENFTNQRGFALWKESGGETWAGFEAWRDHPTATQAAAERLGRLLADPRAVEPEIFGHHGGAASLPLADLVSGVLRWLGTPLRLRDLTDAVAEWQGVRAGRGEVLLIDADDEEAVTATSSAAPSPHDELRWKEYLLWLWREAARLTLRQRTAFLLHSSCLREMEQVGLTGIRQAATLLEIPPEQMAVHWVNLPLEDRLIGKILGAGTQQVINLRKVARGILGRAWQNFLREK